MRKEQIPQKNILILNADPDETSFLKSLCSDIGSVYTASNLEEAITILLSCGINVLVVDSSLAGYSGLRGLFKPYTSIVIVGDESINLKRVADTWPADRYIDIVLISEAKADASGFKRFLETAMRHSLLLHEVQSLRLSSEQSNIEFQEGYHQIQEVKSEVEKSFVSERDKRIAKKAKYAGLKHEHPSPPLNKMVIEKYSSKSEDKRKYKRYDANTYFVYKRGAKRKEVRTLNISLGGVKILSEINFECGQSFDLSLIMGKVVLECKGDIVHTHPAENKPGFYVSGIKFRDLSYNDWKVLDKYFTDFSVKEKATH